MARRTETGRVDRQGHWWRGRKGEVHLDVHKAMVTLHDQHMQRASRIEEALKFYGISIDREQSVPDLSVITEEAAAGGSLPLPINVIAMVVDAFIAKVCRSQLKVTHVPVGTGLASAKRQAIDRTRFTDGIWYETRFREQSLEVAFDATVCCVGHLKISDVRNSIEHDVVHPEELVWDRADAKYGRPRTLAQRRPVDRDCLVDLYPSHGAEIDTAGALTGNDFGLCSTTSDQVLLTEAWHLPSGPNAGDGRHVLVIDNATLWDEEWTEDSFPFASLRWAPAARGFVQTGLVDDLKGIQIAINDLITQALQNLSDHANPWIAVPNSAGINDTDFTDEGRRIVRFNGAVAPQFMTPPQIVPGEVYAQIERMTQRAFERAGLSQMEAASQTPAGLSASGRAIRVRSDVGTARHVLAGRAWEQYHVDASEQDLRAGRRVFERNPKFSTLHVGRRYGQFTASTVAFEHIDRGQTKFVVRPYPANLLPEDPAGKLATAAELEDRGYLSPETSMDLIDAPELERTVELKTAGVRVIEWAIERILADGIYVAPERFWPLGEAIVRAQAQYCLAQQDDVPPENLAMLQQFMVEANETLKAIEAENQPPAPMAPPGPVPAQAQGAMHP